MGRAKIFDIEKARMIKRNKEKCITNLPSDKSACAQGHIYTSKNGKNSSTELNLICDKGHKYSTTWGNFQQGKRCPICAIQ